MSDATPPRLALVLISASALAYEVLLMRLFSVIQWHHFAYMIISLALLGYGASGAFLSRWQTWLLPRYAAAFIGNALLFALTAVAGFAVAQQLPFNAEELLWDWRQSVYLFQIYLLLALPFFFAANCIALSFANYRDVVPRVYAMDLLGAGLGSIAIIAILFVATPAHALNVVACSGLLACAAGSWHLRRRQRWIAGLLFGAGLGTLALPTTPLHISPYKSLPQSLQIGGTHIVTESSSPLAWLTVVESRNVPWRHAPGLSLMASQEPPQQYAVFSDGDNMSAITRFGGDLKPLAYLDQMTSALPYHLGTRQRAALLAADTGENVLQARFHNVAAIDAVELNPQVTRLIQRDFADFAGPVFAPPQVQLHHSDARGFIGEHPGAFDLIAMPLPSSASGLQALSESYLYTVEAVRTYLAGLRPGGYLVFNGWIELPPRNALKLVATVITALRDTEQVQPEQQLLFIRSWQTFTLLVKNQALTENENARAKRFCQERSFDVAWYPGMSANEANRYNILRDTPFYEGIRALLSPAADSFRDQYKFDLTPATDNRPYFFHFFKWGTQSELLALRDRGGMVLLEWGYLVLVATLFQALAASVLFIWWPLRLLPRQPIEAATGWRRRIVLSYFFVLGLAFLFIEIAFIQKLILFLHHPVYAASVAIATFLLWAGLGSFVAQRYNTPDLARRTVLAAVLAIVAITLGYGILLDPLLANLNNAPLLLKGLVASLVIAPLGFAMGMPFPLGLSQLARDRPDLLPWAWGVNGCASVISAVLATLIAIGAGFRTVLLAAVALYCIAAALFPSHANVNK